MKPRSIKKGKYLPPKCIQVENPKLGKGDCLTGSHDADICLNGSFALGACDVGFSGSPI